MSGLQFRPLVFMPVVLGPDSAFLFYPLSICFHKGCWDAFDFLKIYLFIFGCVGSSLLRVGPLQSRRVGATLPCGALAPHCGGLSCRGARAPGARASAAVAHGLQSTGSAAVAHGLSCSAACGILPDQGSNPRPLNWQADSQPLRHQGSPDAFDFKRTRKSESQWSGFRVRLKPALQQPLRDGLRHTSAPSWHLSQMWVLNKGLWNELPRVRC